MKVVTIPINSVRARFMNRKLAFIEKLSEYFDVYVLDVKEPWRTEVAPPMKAKYLEHIRFFENYKFSINNALWNETINSPYNLLLLRKILKNADLIINFDNIIWNQKLIKVLSKKRVPMVFDISDYTPAFAKDPAFRSVITPLIEVIMKQSFNVSIKESSFITTASKGLADYARELRRDDKVTIIPNGTDINVFKPLKDILSDGVVRLGFVGAMRWWVGLEKVIMALPLLVRKINCKLILLGGGSERSKYERLAEKLGVKEHIEFYKPVQYEKVPLFINKMDVCLLFFKKIYLTHTASPLKLFDYLACKRPVLSARLHEVKRLFGNLVYYADSTKEIIEKILEIVDDPSDAKERAEKCYRIVRERHDWKKLSEKFLNIIKGLAQGI